MTKTSPQNHLTTKHTLNLQNLSQCIYVLLYVLRSMYSPPKYIQKPAYKATKKRSTYYLSPLTPHLHLSIYPHHHPKKHANPGSSTGNSLAYTHIRPPISRTSHARPTAAIPLDAQGERKEKKEETRRREGQRNLGSYKSSR